MKRVVLGVLIAVATVLAPAATAAGATSDVEHLHFAAGPYRVIPGANLILDQLGQVPKPNVDGFMLGMRPNLVYARPNGKCCGRIPDTHVVHLHHGVWLSDGPAGEGEGNSLGSIYPFMAAGEEKTAYTFPRGFGYPIGARDHWILNYMIHNLTASPMSVYITYDLDFLPATSPAASTITPVHPIWMDVMDHHVYPVFDVRQHSGRDGRFTFPDMAKQPYGTGGPLNEFQIDHPGVLVGTGGHLHPGGLYDDLDLIRPGVRPAHGTIPGSVPGSVRLFRSRGDYWDKGRQPVSWDVSMTVTPADWRPVVKAGDTLRISSTYDTKLASWYEVMGIMVVWEAWNDGRGVNPFKTKLDERGLVTHGHLAENSYYGGTRWVGVNPTLRPSCRTTKVLIAGFKFIPARTGNTNCVPVVARGGSITFVTEDANPLGTFDIVTPNPFYLASVFHTVTSCTKPCALNYGISYPLANGVRAFDSGELGAGLPAVGRLSWTTPKNLPPGTYRFFCRIHPWMRGVFRVLH